MIVPQPVFRVKYNGKDISSEMASYILSCTYTDYVEGQSDEISINLEDTDENWIGAWYPEKGAKLELEIEYKGKTLKCGTFEIDEIEVSGPPLQVNIRGLAAGVTKAVRTKKNRKFEGKTLKQIATQIAGEYGFTVVGEVPEVTIDKLTQHQKKDLKFLHDLAVEYGAVFSVRNKQLVFTSLGSIEGKNAIKELDRSEVLSFTLRDKAVETYKDAKVKHYSQDTKKPVVQSEKITNLDGIDFSMAVPSADTANVFTRANDPKVAETQAKAVLYRSITKQNEGSVSVEGDPSLVAGINVELTGFGVISGKYHVSQSSHSIDKSGGYRTDIEVKRVKLLQNKAKQKQKRPKTTQSSPSLTPSTGGTGTITNRDGISFRVVQ